MVEEIAWQWVTASRILSKRPCWFLGAEVVPSSGTHACSFYDGADTGGKLIVTVAGTVQTPEAVRPPGAIPCYNGLYVDLTTAITGVLVYWKPIPWEKEA